MRVLSYLLLGLGILSLGFSGIFVRWAEAPGVVTSFYRMAIATAALGWPYLRRLGASGSPRVRLRRGLEWAALGGVFFAADLALWSTGVVLGGATNPTLLANTAPLWVGLGALLLFRERLRPLFWIGLLLAMAGAAVILGLDALSASALGLGSLLGLLAGVFYGAYFLAAQRGRERTDALGYFWPTALTSTALLFLLSAALGQPLTGYSLRTYLNFLGLGLVTQSLGYLAITYALGHLPASLVAPTLLGQPVVTALLAGPLLGEVISWGHAAGGAGVLAGVYLVHYSRREGAG